MISRATRPHTLYWAALQWVALFFMPTIDRVYTILYTNVDKLNRGVMEDFIEGEAVKVSAGYEYPLSDDPYSKKKAFINVYFYKGAKEIDRPKLEDELDSYVDRIAVRFGEKLQTKGIEMFDSIVEQACEARIKEIEDACNKKIEKAREEYIKLKDELDGIKDKENN